MPKSAAVAVAARNGPQEFSETKVSRVVLSSSSLAARVSRWGRRVTARILAKFAYHDSRLYRSLVYRAANLAGQAEVSAALLSAIRKLDPQGLGVWYLSRIAQAPKLTDLCRRAIALPRI